MSRAVTTLYRWKPVALFASTILLAGCAGGEITPDSERDRAASALSAIPQMENSPNGCATMHAGQRFFCKSKIRTSSGKIQPFATASGFGPPDLKSAYNLNTALTPGATIAIVDAFGYTNAASDLATYRSNYGLPACTTASGCLKIVNQTGGTTLPAQPTSSDDWTVETALDLDMASSACPNCKLLLVQATDDSSDGLYIAQKTASSLGATVISNSWGGPETAGSPATSTESYFAGLSATIFVAAGDSGYDDGGEGPDYPSTSAYAVAVGGTSLTKSSTTRGWTEGAWSDGGSSCSLSIPKPSYQSSIATTCNFKAASDVASVGDPNTGLAVYNNGPSSKGWIVVGGTSAASPFVAGVYALTGASGVGYAYAHTSSFYDVTTGTNGTCGTILCKAGAGWDGPTGWGTPNGAALTGGGTGGSGGTGGGGGTGGTGGTGGGGGTGGTGGTGGGGGTGGTGGSGGGGGTCSHPICTAGTNLTSSCDPCATKICGVDSYCCATAWDSICVGEVQSVCGESCTGGGGGSGGTGGGGGGGGGSCSHPICSTGAKLKTGCDPCATKICKADSYCCGTKWDSVCVGEVGSICGESCN